MTISNNRPPLLGYIRLCTGMDVEGAIGLRRSLFAFAEHAGFELDDVYIEDGPGQRLGVWSALISDCRSGDVRDVVVPSSDHFHHTLELAEFMRGELANAINGTVWVAHRHANEVASRDA
ncbi:recombinase family protein [Streptomyces sp. NPDC126933]|uniref:recombinase family protein n=1 Tax=unclassified Streptomyces TaxID=2593676 RepID=UPI00364DF9A8